MILRSNARRFSRERGKHRFPARVGMRSERLAGNGLRLAGSGQHCRVEQDTCPDGAVDSQRDSCPQTSDSAIVSVKHGARRLGGERRSGESSDYWPRQNSDLAYAMILGAICDRPPQSRPSSGLS